MRLHSTLLIALVIGASFSLTAQVTPDIQLFFDYDHDELRPDAVDSLTVGIDRLEYAPEEYLVQLYGHTDQDGSDAYNRDLSERRAESARQYLIEQGFIGDYIVYTARGEQEAIQTTPGRQNQIDRRVDVLFTRLPKPSAEPVVAEAPDRMLPEESRPVKRITRRFDAALGLRYEHPSGTVVEVPPHTLVYPDGRPVYGPVTMTYVEHRDRADIIASGLPMYYVRDDGVAFQYNSTGMFELQAYQEGKPLKVRRGNRIKVDFSMTDELPSTNFYRLDADRRWQEERPVYTDATRSVNASAGVVAARQYIRPIDQYYGACDFARRFDDAVARGEQARATAEWVLAFLELPDEEARRIIDITRKGYLQASFDSEEYAGMHVVPDPADEALLDNDRYYNIRLEVNRKRRRYRFKLDDLTDENSELETVSRVWMQPSERSDRKELEEFFREAMADPTRHVFSDVRLYDEGRLNNTDRDQIKLELKRHGERLVIPVEFYGREGKLTEERAYRMLSNYTVALQERDTLYQAEYRAHWQLNRLLLEWEDEEYRNCPADWLALIRTPKYRQPVRDRYTDILTDPRTAREWTAHLRQRLREHRALWSVAALRELPPSDQTEGASALMVSGFGVYNLDQMYRLQSTAPLVVRATNDGKAIDLDEVYVVNDRLNSALRYSSVEVRYENAKNVRTALLLRDQSNRYYAVTAADFERGLRGRSAFRARLLEGFGSDTDLVRELEL